MYLSILKFNYFIIFHYYRSIYTLLCFKYFTYFHYGQKKNHYAKRSRDATRGGAAAIQRGEAALPVL